MTEGSTSPAVAGVRNPTRFIPQLESLRGWAILLVVGFHYFGILQGGATKGLPEDSPVWLRLLGADNTGVTLFFVLSGFLLAQPFISALKSGKQVNIRRFYIARLMRIVPLYYTAILVAWLVSANSGSALKALLFIPVGFSIFPYSVPWWSLSTEMQFYLLLPWIMLALASRTGQGLVLLGTAGLLALHCIYLIAPQWLGLQNQYWLVGTLLDRGFAFLIGGLAAWLYLSPRYTRLTQSPLMIAVAALVLLIALLWLLQWYGLMGQKPALQAMPLYHDLEALLWGCLLLCCLGPARRGWSVFINPLFSHFGTISYSLYLVHVPIQFYLIYAAKGANGGIVGMANPRMLGAVVGSFLLSWLLAIACYHLIEQPFLRLKSRLPVFSDRLQGLPAKV